MNFFIRNVLFFHLAALVAAFSWIHGGTRPELLLPVIPWLTAFALEILLIFPQARSNETLSEARSRVWRALLRDPFLYAGLLLTAYLVIPLFNATGAPLFDEASRQWRYPTTPLAGLPFCVNADEHAVLLLWFPPVVAAALAAKHGLLKAGKRLLLEMMCWNGAALALLGFAQQATGAKSVFWGSEIFGHFFSTFGYPNFAGAFFTLLFAVSAGLWFGRAGEEVIGPSAGSGTRVDEAPLLGKHGLLIAVFLNFAAAIASLSRAAILLCALLLVVLLVYMVAGVWQKAETDGRVKVLSAVGGMALLVGLSLTVFAPKALKTELATISPREVVDRVTGRGQYHARVAKEIFSDHPAFGVGGWGYPHHMMQYLKPEEYATIQLAGGVNVHNDTLQFLAENGAVGYGLMLTCVLLLVPLAWQAGRVSRANVVTEAGTAVPPKPAWLYRLPPPLMAVLLGTAATVCHSLGDLPFRDPAVLIVWVLSFVSVSGFLPSVRKR